MDEEIAPPHTSLPSLHLLQQIIDEITEEEIPPLHLLQEIIEEEILPRLPAKSLLRFRCVSKPWCSLIESKRFIKSHLQNYTNKTTDCQHWKVIIHCHQHGLRQHGSKESSIISYWDDPLLEPFPINDPKNKHLMAGIVVGHCNGLLCIYNLSNRFFFWNPATKISVELPNFDREKLRIRKWGFGCEEGSGAYKVFVGMSHRELNQIIKGLLYSSKSDSWRTLDEVGSLSLFNANAFACLILGKFHWLTESFYIESFDLKSEVFGRLELPFKPEVGDRLWFNEDEGCLAVECRNDKDKTKQRIWVMKEYGVKESWVEEIFHCLDNKSNSCCNPVFYPESLVSPVLEKD